MARVLVAPRAVFPAVVAQPRWGGALLMTVALVAASSGALFSTAVGRQALIDQRVDTLEGFGQVVDDARYESLRRDAGTLTLQQLGVYVAGLPLATLGVAWLAQRAVAWSAKASAERNGASFAQALAVTAHAGAVIALRYLVLMPWNYLRESLGSPLNASVLFPALEEGGFLSSFLGSIDLFVVWWALVLATGLSVLYRQSVRTVAARIFTAYGVVALAVAGVRTALGAQ
jgi:hypothetical protein